jgi:hypothetical protein
MKKGFSFNGCVLVFGIICIFIISILSWQDDNKRLQANDISKNSNEKVQQTDIKPEEKRLSVRAQEQENKGIYYEEIDRFHFSFLNVWMYQIYSHPKFDIHAFYIDIEKYPQLADNVLPISEDIVQRFYKNDTKKVDVYVYSYAPDLYYLRNYRQDIPKDLILELERLDPILSISYEPGIYKFLSVCVLTKSGYQAVGKSFSNGWQWENIGLNKCGYEYTKRIWE